MSNNTFKSFKCLPCNWKFSHYATGNTPCFPQSQLSEEVTAVCFENYTKHVNTCTKYTVLACWSKWYIRPRQCMDSDNGVLATERRKKNWSQQQSKGTIVHKN